MSNPPDISMPQGLPAIYFNGFATGFGGIDLSVILLLNHNPALELKMTYSTAKNLSSALAEAVSKFEKHSGQKVINGAELSKIVSESVAASERK
jgi:hypothetical protein